ncbi:MAG: PRC-barrel domain-containing protein [Afipia sp.]|nr:PRC-barrel domain-containing protein [Afipia sp.]
MVSNALRLTVSATGLLAILAAAPTPAPAPVEKVAPESAMSIMGVTVQGPAGKDIGRLTDVLVGLDGKPVAAVIDFGGFLGVGNRKVAVDWKTLKFSPGDKNHPIMLEMAPDQVRAAPDYKDQQPAPVVKPDLVKTETAKTQPAKPEAVQPDLPKAETGKPVPTAEPNPTQPTPGQPTPTQPSATRPDTVNSDPTMPNAPAPDAAKSGATQPNAPAPTAIQPDAGKPDAVKPGPSG